MTKKLNVVDLDQFINNPDTVKDNNTNYEEIVKNVDDNQSDSSTSDEHVEPVKKTSRRPKATKKTELLQVEDKPIEEKPVEVIEINISDPIDDKKKNIKTVELVECPKCGKKLTERTLKYSHPIKCPKNENKPKEINLPKSENKPDEINLLNSENKPDEIAMSKIETKPLGVLENRLLKIKEKQERYKNLARNAFI